MAREEVNLLIYPTKAHVVCAILLIVAGLLTKNLLRRLSTLNSEIEITPSKASQCRLSLRQPTLCITALIQTLAQQISVHTVILKAGQTIEKAAEDCDTFHTLRICTHIKRKLKDLQRTITRPQGKTTFSF